MSTKISAIIPIYNVENYLEQCLDSLINQTLQEIELICINDGSTDNSGKILDKYIKKDNRIIAVKKSNSGYGSSCNIGLKVAKGEYISIIEADDFIDSKMFEDLYNLATKNNADIVKSPYYEYQKFDNSKEEIIEKIDWDNQYIMPTNVFTIIDCPQLLYFHPSIWSCIYRKAFLDKNKIKFVEVKGAGWADNPFQIQTLCLAERIMYTDKAYYYYRLNNPSSSSNIVNISNPFDRSDEVHSFLEKHNINDKNILTHLYKREISYIHIVLKGINEELIDFANNKIFLLLERMDENIIKNNPYITDYEKSIYYQCKTKNGIKQLMKKLQQDNKLIEVIKTE